MTNKNRIPKFNSAAEERKWFLHDGLHSRISHVPESEKRAFITVKSCYGDVNIMEAELSTFFTVMIDENDIDAAIDKVYEGLCQMPDAQNDKFEPTIYIDGAWGQNSFSMSGQVGPVGVDSVFELATQQINEAKEGGFLTPKDVKYDQSVLVNAPKAFA